MVVMNFHSWGRGHWYEWWLFILMDMQMCHLFRLFVVIRLMMMVVMIGVIFPIGVMMIRGRCDRRRGIIREWRWGVRWRS